MVNLPFSRTAVMAATRPPVSAEPMFRAPNPEMVSESKFTPCAARCKHRKQGASDTNAQNRKVTWLLLSAC
jgi:hypothetical protein